MMFDLWILCPFANTPPRALVAQRSFALCKYDSIFNVVYLKGFQACYNINVSKHYFFVFLSQAQYITWYTAEATEMQQIVQVKDILPGPPSRILAGKTTTVAVTSLACRCCCCYSAKSRQDCSLAGLISRGGPTYYSGIENLVAIPYRKCYWNNLRPHKCLIPNKIYDLLIHSNPNMFCN